MKNRLLQTLYLFRANFRVLAILVKKNRICQHLCSFHQHLWHWLRYYPTRRVDWVLCWWWRRPGLCYPMCHRVCNLVHAILESYVATPGTRLYGRNGNTLLGRWWVSFMRLMLFTLIEDLKRRGGGEEIIFFYDKVATLGWDPNRWRWIDRGRFLNYTTKDGRKSIIKGIHVPHMQHINGRATL